MASQSTAASETIPAAAAAPQNEMTGRARRRVAGLLASGTAGLHSFDRRLEALASRDWSLSAVVKNLDHAARETTAALEKRARERLRRLDQLPVDAAAATFERSRSAVHALSTALERAAKRVHGNNGATPAP